MPDLTLAEGVPEDGPVRDLFAELLRLHRAAGGPSARRMAGDLTYGHAQIHKVLRGPKVPTQFELIEKIVGYLGGDVATVAELWRAARASRTRISSTCPYKGLRPFTIDDHDLFHGREELTERLVGSVRDAPSGTTIAVVGASGAGKSSLLAAGLCAELRERPTLIRRPGYGSIDDLVDELSAFDAGHPDPLVVIDQFEEIFSADVSPADRERFIGTVAGGLAHAVTVLGVRADHYDECLSDQRLSTVLRERQVVVGAMSEEELRRAIRRPAEQAGSGVEPSLVEMLAGESRPDGPGALPLLSHALAATWHARGGPHERLDRRAYLATGGVARAIAESAEACFDALPDDRRDLVRHVFHRLTTVAGDPKDARRRRIDRSELPDDAGVAAVLAEFADERLLTLGRSTVEIAHEALLSAWPRLAGWLAEDQEIRRTHRAVSEASHRWKQHGRKAGYLLHGSDLARATRSGRPGWLVFNGAEREFLRASRRRVRWIRATGATVSVLLVVSLAGVVLAGERRREDDSRWLAGQAAAYRVDRPEAALHLSLASWREAPTPEARGALMSAAMQPFLATIAYQGTSALTAFSPDGKLLAVGTSEGEIQLWDPVARVKAGASLTGTGRFGAIGFGRDGTELVTVPYHPASGEVQVWSVGRREPVRTYPVPALFESVAISPDGRWILFSGNDSSVLDTTTGERRDLGGRRTGVFSPDSRLAVLTSPGPVPDTGVADVVEVRTGRRVAAIGEFGEAGMLFSADSTQLILLSRDGVQGVSTATGKAVAPLPDEGPRLAVRDGKLVTVDTGSRELFYPELPLKSDATDVTGPLQGFSTSPDRALAAVQDGSGTVRLVDVRSLTAVDRTLPAPGGRLMLLGPGGGLGAWIGPGSGGRTMLRLTEAATGRPLFEEGMPERLPLLAWHDSGSLEGLVSFSHTGAASVLAADGTVTVIDPAASERRRLSVGPHGEGLAAALSPDGRRLLVLRIVDQRQDIELWDLATSSRRWSVREPARPSPGPRALTAPPWRSCGTTAPSSCASCPRDGRSARCPSASIWREPDGWPSPPTGRSSPYAASTPPRSGTCGTWSRWASPSRPPAW